MAEITIELDLVEVIRQSVDQVYGSDERELLRQWLGRNTEPAQLVQVVLPELVICLAEE